MRARGPARGGLYFSPMRRPARKPIRADLTLVLALVLPLPLASCASLGYLWSQAGPFFRSSTGGERIASLLEDPRTSETLRAFLRSVSSIKRFAVERIGLADNDNFTTYKVIDRGYLVAVVQASDPLSFTPFTWSYPLLGRLPYRGYYDPREARAEADRLERRGYDVIVREVDDFSTLGYLSDPVYSFMVEWPPFELASTIIHEQTHATLFVKGQDQFNEELATFVGDEGALEYLAERYGVGSEQYRQGLSELADSRLFLRYLASVTKELEKVYGSSLPREEKLERKREIIARFERIYRRDYAPRFHSGAYRREARLPLNNAYLLLYALYTDHIPLLARFERERCGSSLETFVREVERLAESRGNMIEKIQAALAAPPREATRPGSTGCPWCDGTGTRRRRGRAIRPRRRSLTPPAECSRAGAGGSSSRR